MRIRALLLAIVFALISHVSAYFISIDANEEQCFFDRVVANTKMGLMFEVAEGGFLDIDVKVIFGLNIFEEVCSFYILTKCYFLVRFSRLLSKEGEGLESTKGTLGMLASCKKFFCKIFPNSLFFSFFLDYIFKFSLQFIFFKII